ncbi:MAG: HAMP domain-containing sensor histidine kinase [Polyangiaceae bacterium]
MGTLADILDAEREAVVQRFADRIFQTTDVPTLDREDVINSLRAFLAELVAELADEQQSEPLELPADPIASAIEHGGQRFTLGYDIGTLVREYGALRDILFLVMEESGQVFTFREMRIVSKFFIGGIADASAKYCQERDEELRRQTSRHLGFLAHELRNPVSSMRLAFTVLENKGKLDLEDRAVGVLGRSMAKLGALIDHALMGARLESGAELNVETIAVREFLEELVAETASEAEDKAISIHLACSVDHVVADPKLLHSAMANLVRNAVKFTHRGGTIQLRVGRTADRFVLQVEDGCGGLPEGRAQTLFEPFVQAGSDRSGFGLGLAIAKQAADAHQGSLRVRDVPGSGCVFVLELPAGDAPEPPRR